jgi:Tol biopolymer transport system component
MSNYNKKEKYIAGLLSKTPGLKQRIKKLYSRINYLVYKKNHTFKTDLPIQKLLSDERNESFFGYYDKSPVSPDGKHIAFHETTGIHSNFSPNPYKPLSIMIFDKEKNEYKKTGTTSAYNWQQGARLMWLNVSELIYNDFEKESFVSRIHNVYTGAVRTLDAPVYDCFEDKFALSLDFSRLHELNTDYGYRNTSGSYRTGELKNDGVYYIDLKSGEKKLIISLDQAINLHHKPNMKDAEHCFNHIMISPDGKNFIFIHRWYQNNVKSEALLLCDINGKKVTALTDSDFVSHFCWHNNETVIGYLRHDSFGNSFYRIDINSGKTELLSKKLLGYGDGHPSVFGNKILFDSYPDRCRMQHLYTYDMIKVEIEEKGSFLSPMKFFGSNRCDLHPRWSPDERSVYFDSVHEGTRKLYRMDINDKK